MKSCHEAPEQPDQMNKLCGIRGGKTYAFGKAFIALNNNVKRASTKHVRSTFSTDLNSLPCRAGPDV